MSDVLKIGNAQGFWGDAGDAPARLVAQQPDLNVLTLDYLAEVSMSILARQQQRDPNAGFARDFLDVVRSMVPVWEGGRKLTVVTNAGGLNPKACAEAVKAMAVRGMRIAVISGDDVLAKMVESPGERPFRHLETGESLETVRDRLVTANAYLGATAVAEAIRAGANMVITGRVADPSLTVGPCIAHFGWAADAYDRIAGATVAGHLIECGTQVTGGISTDWMSISDGPAIGFPVVEVASDGSCVVTKPKGTGGRVDLRTVKEQLVYELGDPANYLSPDATVSFLNLKVRDLGGDRVRVEGAIGRPPPSTYKVSATYRAGFRAAGTLTIFGRDAAAKARRCGEIVLRKLKDAGCEPARSLVECIGGGDVVKGVGTNQDTMECVLRIAVADERREVVERFAKEMTPLVTSGPQGTTGYAEGRPVVREAIGYWPCLIERERGWRRDGR